MTSLRESTLSWILPQRFRPYVSTILIWTVVGYLMRILIMPLFAHEDVLTNALMSITLLQKHQMYTIYPSLVFLPFVSVFALFSPFLPRIFVDELTSNVIYRPVQLFNIYHLSQPSIQTFIFVSKIPMLVFDFALAFLILRMFNEEKNGLLAFKLWMLCPISIFVSYFFGQFDVIPTFFMTLGLYFFKTHKTKSSVFSLGLCSALKLFGLFLIPPLILAYVGERKNLAVKAKQAFVTFGIGLLPLLLSEIVSFLWIPIYYESANMALLGRFDVIGFWGNTYYVRSQVTNPVLAQFSYFGLSAESGVSGVASSLFIASYVLFLFATVYWKKWSAESLFLVPLLLFYLITPFHPQWFLWIMPLLVLMAAEHRDWFFKLYLLVLPLYFFSSIFIQNMHLTSNLLSPTILQAYYWPGPIDLLDSVGIPGYRVVVIFSSVFLALLLVYLILVVVKRNENF